MSPFVLIVVLWCVTFWTIGAIWARYTKPFSDIPKEADLALNGGLVVLSPVLAMAVALVGVFHAIGYILQIGVKHEDKPESPSGADLDDGRPGDGGIVGSQDGGAGGSSVPCQDILSLDELREFYRRHASDLDVGEAEGKWDDD